MISLSVDEKGRYLNMAVGFLGKTAGWTPNSAVVGYREFGGLAANDVLAIVKQVFEEHRLDEQRLMALTADGASAMRTCVALGHGCTDNTA